jgi:hypothetical protein
MGQFTGQRRVDASRQRRERKADKIAPFQTDRCWCR